MEIYKFFSEFIEICLPKIHVVDFLFIFTESVFVGNRTYVNISYICDSF